jgi:hypothetical protein
MDHGAAVLTVPVLGAAAVPKKSITMIHNHSLPRTTMTTTNDDDCISSSNTNSSSNNK